MSGHPSRRVALFGGTFDPIHRGHLQIASLAKDKLDLDEVRFLPCHTSPHKVGVLTAPPMERLEMVRLATADLPWAVVDRHDLDCPQPAYSYRTAEEMDRNLPDTTLFWLMGADQWRSLPRWKEPDRLARVVEFIVFARDGVPRPHPGWRMHFLSGQHPASSSAIRLALAEGTGTGDWLPPAVADFIRVKALYKP